MISIVKKRFSLFRYREMIYNTTYTKIKELLDLEDNKIYVRIRFLPSDHKQRQPYSIMKAYRE